MKKSKGHILFCQGQYGVYEFYHNEGKVFRANAESPIQPDGYRGGRVETSREHFRRHKSLLIGKMVILQKAA